LTIGNPFGVTLATAAAAMAAADDGLDVPLGTAGLDTAAGMATLVVGGTPSLGAGALFAGADMGFDVMAHWNLSVDLFA
jgi:hypothetical protein